MNEVYKTIWDRLDTQLTVDVFDNVPEKYNSFPYVVLDTIVARDFDTDTELAFNSTIQVISYSRYKGSKEISNLNLEIYNALHRWVAVDSANYSIANITQEFSTIALESDGLTRQSIQRFNLIFEKI